MSRATGTPGRLAMPRRRGAIAGLLITLAGIWCAAIPFVGHYLNFVVGRDTAFDMTPGRFWLSLVPGIVAVGGLMVMRSGNRATATLGAQLALAAGIWLIIGRELSLLWTSSWTEPPTGGTDKQALELLTYFYGAGALITALAGFTLGRVSARHAGDVERLTDTTAVPVEERTTTTGGRFSRRRDPVDEPGLDREHARRDAGVTDTADEEPATRTSPTRA